MNFIKTFENVFGKFDDDEYSLKYKTISFYGKTDDNFDAIVTDQVGNQTEFSFYPPRFLGDGDGIKLEIDLETGQILNWEEKKASIDADIDASFP